MEQRQHVYSIGNNIIYNEQYPYAYDFQKDFFFFKKNEKTQRNIIEIV